MKNKNVIAKINRKLREMFVPVLSKYRVKKINNTDFTIISNNCWAGYVYRYFGLRYNTPTIGTYFFAEDYVKFITNLEHYMSYKLEIIDTNKSKNFEILKKNNQLTVPIGKLDDIEIVFLHYNSKEEALSKWQRRSNRINYNNIIIKFSEMNNCTTKHMVQFDQFGSFKKVMFISNNYKNYKCGVYYKGYEKNKQILDDTFYWNKYLNIYDLINSPKTKYCKKNNGNK